MEALACSWVISIKLPANRKLQGVGGVVASCGLQVSDREDGAWWLDWSLMLAVRWIVGGGDSHEVGCGFELGGEVFDVGEQPIKDEK